MSMTTEPKITMLKWTHPEWFDSLITEPNASHFAMAESYGNGHPGPYGEPGLEALTVEVVHMTQAEIDAHPGWDG